jgi:hypothetical protein
VKNKHREKNKRQIKSNYYYYYVIFEVLDAVTMKNAVFWVVTPCGSCKNRHFGGPHAAKKYYDIVFLRSLRWLVVTDNVVPSSLILVTLMMEALDSSLTSDLTRAIRSNIPEDGINDRETGSNSGSTLGYFPRTFPCTDTNIILFLFEL